MQVEVDKVLQAATDTGHFNTITDRPFKSSDYPALVIQDRETVDVKPEGDLARIYKETWQYDVFVMLKETGGFSQLETISGDFIAAMLTSGEFELVRQKQYEAVVNGRNVLVNAISISTQVLVSYK